MKFDFDVYVQGCYTVPIILVLFFSIDYIALIWNFVKKIKNKAIKIRDVLGSTFGIVIFTCFLMLSIGPLINGGIAVGHEEKSDAVRMEGSIEDIENLYTFSFPKTSPEYSEREGEITGYRFWINGISCIAFEKGNLQVGDTVTVLYLPKSGYVLEIGPIGES